MFPSEWIEKIIRIDSVTHKSNHELVQFLIPLLKAAGLKVEEQVVMEDGVRFSNLIAYNQQPSAVDSLLFNTHLDTVTAGSSDSWTKTGGDPFRATVVGDKVFGLGTADVKIDFLCKLWAAREARPEHPFVLVGTYGEERGLVGVQQLLRSGRVKPKYALVGEPSKLELIYAHKGHLVGCLSFGLERGPIAREKSWAGRAAHSSTPSLGSNAVQKGFTEIFRRGWGIAHLEGGTDTNKVPEACTAKLTAKGGRPTNAIRKSVDALGKIARAASKKPDRRFSPSLTTLSFNLARTSDGRLQLTFDMRLLPDLDIPKLNTQVEKIASLGGKWESLTIDAPLRGAKDSVLIQSCSAALKRCKIKPVVRTKASSTEAAVYGQFGVSALVFGPGISVGNVHRPNEYNLLKQIEAATRFYTEVLRVPPGTR